LPQTATNCINCHNTAQNDTKVAGPSGGRRSVTNEFIYASHHVSGTLTNADCLVCHYAETNNHKDGLVQLTDPDNAAITYTESSAGAYRPEGLTSGDVAALTAFCQNCHDDNGAARLGTSARNPFSGGGNVKAVGTHSNQDFSGLEQKFYVGCAQCHTSHGSSNLAIIHSQVVITPGLMSGPVVFTAHTGAGSRDNGSGDGICVICHAHDDNPGHPMAKHNGGYHIRDDIGNKLGTDCSTCHNHEPDNNTATFNGHMPAGPNAVGLYGMLAQGGVWPVLGLVGMLCAVIIQRRKHR